MNVKSIQKNGEMGRTTVLRVRGHPPRPPSLLP